jgi:hypothetical protein
MKILQAKSLGIAFLIVITGFLSSAFTFSDRTEKFSSHVPPKWELLGLRKVNYALDRDEIQVRAKEGLFSAVKIKVNQAPINLRRMVIHYGNGSTQEVIIRKNIPAGGESRVIDINGGRRVVKKVVFWYDTKNMGRRRATLALWGRH